ncbi:MAG: hypothetical protein IPJ79_07085 [Bacteroidetes bacterium]|nr:hypothetical protein [Bacteroidota bacterium]
MKSKYPIETIGSTYKIAKRNWDKRNEKAKIFKYIEIGAIDPIEGILEAKELPVAQAPSRATQKIKANDLIIGTTRPYLKKFAIVNRNIMTIFAHLALRFSNLQLVITCHF